MGEGFYPLKRWSKAEQITVCVFHRGNLDFLGKFPKNDQEGEPFCFCKSEIVGKVETFGLKAGVLSWRFGNFRNDSVNFLEEICSQTEPLEVIAQCSVDLYQARRPMLNESSSLSLSEHPANSLHSFRPGKGCHAAFIHGACSCLEQFLQLLAIEDHRFVGSAALDELPCENKTLCRGKQEGINEDIV